MPDAQRIADYIVENFAAMRKADADLTRGEAIETIAVARPAPVAAHKPIEVGEAKAEPRARKKKRSARSTQSIDAPGEADRRPCGAGSRRLSRPRLRRRARRRMRAVHFEAISELLANIESELLAYSIVVIGQAVGIVLPQNALRAADQEAVLLEQHFFA